MVLEHPGLIDPPNPTETKDYTLLQCKSIVFGWTYEQEYGEQNLYVTTACSLATLIFSHSVCLTVALSVCLVLCLSSCLSV